MLPCYCWGSMRISSAGLGAARQTLIKLSGWFVGTSSILAVMCLTAQHLSHCAWLFGIHGAWPSFSCCWGALWHRLTLITWHRHCSLRHQMEVREKRKKKKTIRERETESDGEEGITEKINCFEMYS